MLYEQTQETHWLNRVSFDGIMPWFVSLCIEIKEEGWMLFVSPEGKNFSNTRSKILLHLQPCSPATRLPSGANLFREEEAGPEDERR